MNILVIGLGSMGKRRISLIKEMHPNFEVLGIDGRDDRREEATRTLRIKCFPSIGDVSENIGESEIDCVFICTSPLSHAEIISDCLKRKWHVFTELNLVLDGYEYNMKLADEIGVKLFLSSTFLYREETRYIRSKVDVSSNNKWNYIYHIGQYLPDWHPWESYKDFFLGDKRTNGCREILAIELPWIIETFGKIEEVSSLGDKITDLSITYNDNYMIQLTHENGNKGMLVVDVVSPVAVRRFETYTENQYIRWEGTPDSLKEFDIFDKKLKSVELIEKQEHRDGYANFVVENAYKNEIQEFFDVIEGKCEALYGFEQDLDTLNIIEKIGA